ncbi:MAG: hypothetical protein R6U62_08240 [Bacteroidales bacterium]
MTGLDLSQQGLDLSQQGLDLSQQALDLSQQALDLSPKANFVSFVPSMSKTKPRRHDEHKEKTQRCEKS